MGGERREKNKKEEPIFISLNFNENFYVSKERSN
jgi:hypothetical protein